MFHLNVDRFTSFIEQNTPMSHLKLFACTGKCFNILSVLVSHVAISTWYRWTITQWMASVFWIPTSEALNVFFWRCWATNVFAVALLSAFAGLLKVEENKSCDPGSPTRRFKGCWIWPSIIHITKSCICANWSGLDGDMWGGALLCRLFKLHGNTSSTQEVGYVHTWGMLYLQRPWELSSGPQPRACNLKRQASVGRGREKGPLFFFSLSL